MRHPRMCACARSPLWCRIKGCRSDCHGYYMDSTLDPWEPRYRGMACAHEPGKMVVYDIAFDQIVSPPGTIEEVIDFVFEHNEEGRGGFQVVQYWASSPESLKKEHQHG